MGGFIFLYPLVYLFNICWNVQVSDATGDDMKSIVGNQSIRSH